MTNSAIIEASGLTKQYGTTVAVDDLSFQVLPGQVTGFLGPNGAGKSTTLRMIMGLDTPTKGTVTIGGRPYNEHRRPLFEVGALLDAHALHSGRSAYNHLLCLAQSNGIGRPRVAEVLELVGLTSVARKRAGGFSLGMGQRLGIAAALLGDPEVLLFDEPVNGLDPEGIVWIRNLMRSLAADGHCIFVSSHLMSEMALTADQIIVLGRGKIIADAPVSEILAQVAGKAVRVRTPERAKLTKLLEAKDVTLTATDPDILMVNGLAAANIGEIAAKSQVVLHELTPMAGSLEDAYLALTEDEVEYHAGSLETEAAK
jgi:ABC-2 type transport system ATP-binding protein